MSAKVSIVIPVFDKAQWIEETLTSVANQSYKNWECIIVDDGSTDSSLSKVRDFIEKTPGNWKVITQPNQGQCVARNRGIEESAGEFIAFLDGDDCWAENKLEVQIEMLLQNEGASLVICPYRIYREGEGNGRFVYHRNTQKMLKNWLNLSGFGGGTESTGLARKSALVSLGGFDPELSTSAGLDLTLRLNELGKILTAKNTYMKYRIHTGQWHSNIEILTQDLALLRAKHQDSSYISRSNLVSKHSAYLRLQKLRQDSSLMNFMALSRECATNLNLLVLLYCILRRNLVARTRAKFPGLLSKIPRQYFKDLFS